MNAPQQLSPTLVLIEDEGDWTVRVGDQANAKQVSQAVVPILATLGAKKLLLITPFDTKVFKFDTPGNGKAPASAGGRTPAMPEAPRKPVVYQDEGAPPSPEDATTDFERFIEEERVAEAKRLEMERLNTADPNLPVVEEMPANVVKRAKAPKDQITPAGSSCGRCQGEGTLLGGATCTVCRGKGKIAKWGGRKR